MEITARRYALSVVAGSVLLLTSLLVSAGRVDAQQNSGAPKFQVDPFWPKPLPDHWVTASVGGTCVDAQDHVFIVSRGDLSPKEKKNATPSTPIVEFDQAGKIVSSWGTYETFPGRPHGCFVDYEGNVWVAGNEDAIVQKYTHDGSKLLLQIGTKGKFDTSDGTMAGAPMNSSHTLLNLPSSIAVDPTNGDIYITDGYGNRRVVVFDREGSSFANGGNKRRKRRPMLECPPCS
jgi:hypothetical protein